LKKEKKKENTHITNLVIGYGTRIQQLKLFKTISNNWSTYPGLGLGLGLVWLRQGMSSGNTRCGATKENSKTAG
jgi:hypothetical protein